MQSSAVFPAQPDVLGGSPTITLLRPSRHSISSTRKENILRLVEMLLHGDGDVAEGPQSSPEDNQEIPRVDDRWQLFGAEAFNKFQGQINQLDRVLGNFANAAQPLGGSVAILFSVLRLRERLPRILFLFQTNAANLFPNKVDHPSKICGPRREVPLPGVNARRAFYEDLTLEAFPAQMEALARDISNLVGCLNEFTEYVDSGVNVSNRLRSFEGDLRYWASCLRDQTGQFGYPSVQQYMQDLMLEMSYHIEGINSDLETLIEVGVPTICSVQKQSASNLLNLSTVAALFSAVTATTLQFSYTLPTSAYANAVNCLWFSSLVFSTAAAVNSLLGVTWRQAIQSPGRRLPWMALIWIQKAPLLFLVMSVGCFSVGLCCFAFATKQAHVTLTLTTAFVALTSFGLTAVSVLYAIERAILLHHHGRSSLGDVLSQCCDPLRHMSAVKRIQKTSTNVKKWLSRLASVLQRAYPRLMSDTDSQCATLGSADDLEANTFPRTHRLDVEDVVDSLSYSNLNTPISPTEKEVQSPVLAKQRWKDVFRDKRMHSTVTPISEAPADRFHLVGEEMRRAVVRRARISVLQPKLNILEPTQDLNPHSKLVKHLQFSPDGKYLATASSDCTSRIFRVEDRFSSHRVLAHIHGPVSQVAWSPDGKFLLTKLRRHIRVWTAEGGDCIRIIDRKTNVESIAWLSHDQENEPAFISVEGGKVTKMDLCGRVIDEYDLGRMGLRAVVAIPDSSRLIGVGPLLESPSGLQPSKSKVENRLVVYNMELRECENQIPVLHDVSDITVVKVREGTLALVSYEDKAPPQLWKLEIIRDRHTNIFMSRLTLQHTYRPEAPVDFASPGHFGGKNNEMVLCTDKTGYVHIWDRESGILLRHLRAQAYDRDLTCVAWNHAFDDPFMFAAGGHDGNVRIWSRHPDETNSPHESNDLESKPSQSNHQDSKSQPYTTVTKTPASNDDSRNAPCPVPLSQRILAHAAAQRAAESRATECAAPAPEAGKPPDSFPPIQ